VRNKSRPPKSEKDNSDKDKADKPDKEKSAGDKDKPASEKDKAPLKKHEYEAQLKTLTDLFSALSPPDKRKPVAHGKHSYYTLPIAYSNSKTFSDKLRADKRCTNCGDCDQHFPRHTARNCPYVSRFPAWIPSDEFAPVLPLQTPRTLNGFPVEFCEPAPYRGTVTRINRGVSNAERGELHIFAGLFTPNSEHDAHHTESHASACLCVSEVVDLPTSAPCIVNVEPVPLVCLTAPSAVALHALVRQSRPIASAAPAVCESSSAIPVLTDSTMLSTAPVRPCEVTNSPHLTERLRASN
jgi:hypothetical protein